MKKERVMMELCLLEEWLLDRGKTEKCSAAEAVLAETVLALAETVRRLILMDSDQHS